MFLLLLLAAIARGYDNDSRGPDGVGLHKGGPHRTINELAFEYAFANMRSPGMGELTEDPGSLLFGPNIIAPGMEFVESGKANQPVRWWVSEGGYTADEPELYNSFRHFYDPTNPVTPYLTDDLEKLNYVYRVLLWTKTGAVVGAIAGTNFNPQVNARDWALTGEEHGGWGANEYCLARGIEYYHLAFTAPGDEKRDEYFAKAWRSLGETMHLLGDMTCVPHVRNDSHPGRALYVTGNSDPNIGLMKNDPYELLCDESMIRKYKDYPVDPVIKAQIDAAPNPAELFYRVASYTNKNFFSSDTIAGFYVSHANNPAGDIIEVSPVNGQHPYPAPKLQFMRFDDDTGYFVNPDNNVRMCHVKWLSEEGWGDIGGMAVTLPCVEDQARVLVPVAIYANARLAKMFLPRFVLSDEQYKKDEQTTVYHVSFNIRHIAAGLHPDLIEVEKFDRHVVAVFVNGERRGTVMAGANVGRPGFSFTPDSPDVQINNGERFTFAVEIGGMLYPGSAAFTFIKEQVAAGWRLDKVETVGPTPRSDIDTNTWSAGGLSPGNITATITNKRLNNQHSLKVTATVPPGDVIQPGTKVPLKIHADLTLNMPAGFNRDNWHPKDEVTASFTVQGDLKLTAPAALKLSAGKPQGDWLGEVEFPQIAGDRATGTVEIIVLWETLDGTASWMGIIRWHYIASRPR